MVPHWLGNGLLLYLSVLASGIDLSSQSPCRERRLRIGKRIVVVDKMGALTGCEIIFQNLGKLLITSRSLTTCGKVQWLTNSKRLMLPINSSIKLTVMGPRVLT